MKMNSYFHVKLRSSQGLQLNLSPNSRFLPYITVAQRMHSDGPHVHTKTLPNRTHTEQMFRSTLRLLQRPSPSLASYTRRNLSFAFPSPRKLNEITDLALLSQESPENVKTIWNIYYEDQVHAHGVTLTAAQHEKIISRAKTW